MNNASPQATRSNLRTLFTIRPPEQASAGSQSALTRLKAAVGGIPNLAAIMATSPALIDAFVTLRTVFHQHSTLSLAEREIVMLTNAVENGCAYCTAIHTAFALKEGVSTATVAAIRAKGIPPNAREAALVEFDRKLLHARGCVDANEVELFIAAGFAADQVLELIAAAAISTLANYSGRLTQAPLDPFLQPHAVIQAA